LYLESCCSRDTTTIIGVHGSRLYGQDMDTRLHSRSPLRASFKYTSEDEEEKWNPTCVSWDWEGRGVIIGWENASVEMWDVERGTATMKLISNDVPGIVPFTVGKTDFRIWEIDTGELFG
jgi:hypothetical protein